MNTKFILRNLKRPLGSSRHNVRIILKWVIKITCEDVGRIQLPYGMDI
jgi:hypothetical protein